MPYIIKTNALIACVFIYILQLKAAPRELSEHNSTLYYLISDNKYN